ncbi:trypsin Inhibitor like cysteine rich domain protein [Oesophagostomum dentatum]|uniref:Trypsin Inhibitor like cysteine rich domain protein n=1 Tax=Oesophagostomum dentatum TaxID=61180 RepID=A0A0B1S457_OESDE|nr:trypsin Inhibitor like cysteine rich domain protein [Oesophagostomum dentatum]
MNEIYSRCSGCEKQCSGNRKMCARQCGPPMCQCRGGYYRHTNGTCVMEENCEEDLTSNCALLLCAHDHECRLVQQNCTSFPCHPAPHCVLRDHLTNTTTPASSNESTTPAETPQGRNN